MPRPNRSRTGQEPAPLNPPGPQHTHLEAMETEKNGWVVITCNCGHVMSRKPVKP